MPATLATLKPPLGSISPLVLGLAHMPSFMHAFITQHHGAVRSPDIRDRKTVLSPETVPSSRVTLAVKSLTLPKLLSCSVINEIVTSAWVHMMLK